MAAGIFPEEDEKSIYFSRTDASENFASFADMPFSLEGKDWATAEHYFQAMKFEDEAQQEKIRNAATPEKARKLGRTRFKRIRKDWKSVRVVYMTRALYTQCHTYPKMKLALLDTEQNRLVENSQYDYFWGCGRDRRGENQYGKVLMNIRNKLRDEAKENQDQD